MTNTTENNDGSTTAGRREEDSRSAPGSANGAPLCPKCGGPLVEQSPRSLLNREQWLAARAGDYLCACHDNGRGAKAVAYYWSNEVGDSPSVPALAQSGGEKTKPKKSNS
jgi:hypothetical protein